MSIVKQLNTALAGRYEVEREIGAGGMATVYLARDLKHERHVALKLLNPELGAVLGVERFLSEIRVTANLQHPNLLPLFDSGEASGLLFYVMPFVDGQSLRVKLNAEKQLPVDEAIRIAVAVANALDYAHGHGVIHRDLKPENILLQHGEPVIADFGIALAVSNAGGARITQTGLSLGTPQYMSPEQATGDRVIDGRTDVYSLAAMLYEMLTGDPPHTASTAQAIVAKVLTERPRDVRASRPSVPDYVGAAVDRGLEKLPADRWATAREFAQALQGKTATFTAMRSAGRCGSASAFSRPVVIGLGVIAVAAITTASVLWSRLRAVPAPEPVRFELTGSDDVTPIDAATWAVTPSPDGRTVVFTGRAKDGKTQLYARPIDQLFARPITGTEGATQPVFSHDGKWIAFVAGNKLTKVPIEGGQPIAIADYTALNGMDWAAGDQIVLGASGGIHGLARVSAAGGLPAVVVTKRDTARKEVDHLWPVVLDDGKTIVFTIWFGGLKTSRLGVTSIDDGNVTPLDVQAIAPLGVFAGHLVYVRLDGVVMAVPFDVSARRITGSPVPVADHVAVCQGCNGDAKVRISRTGTFVNLAGAVDGRLVWVSARGVESPAFGEPRAFSNPRVSPDGKRVLVSITQPENQASTNSWILNIANGTLSRLSSDNGIIACSWTVDSKSAVYLAERGGVKSYYRQAVDGGQAEKLVDAPSGQPCPTLSPDGKTLIYTTFQNNNSDLMAVALDQGGKTRRFAPSESEENGPSFSPDSKWVAYTSSVSGKSEVYVMSATGDGARTQVSDKGGIEPVWGADGKHLYYRESAHVIAATITTSPSVVVTSRATLFDGMYYGDPIWPQYDVGSGPRFLMIKPNNSNIKVVVVANWLAELRRKVAKQ